MLTLFTSFACGKTTSETDSSGGGAGQGGSASARTFVQVACGPSAACALDSEGKAACWGHDWSNTPPNGTFEDISVGTDYACAIAVDHTLACWGDGFSNGPGGLPVGAVSAISASGGTYCVLDDVGQMTCLPTWQADTPPALVPQFTGKYTQVDSGGLQNACALKIDGMAECALEATVPMGPTPNTEFTQITLGTEGACGLDAKGAITCWGSDEALANPSRGYLGTLPSGTWSAIGTGYDQGICGTHKDSVLECWGEFSYLYSADYPGDPPTPITTEPVASFCVGFQYGCAVTNRGSLKCWGFDTDGVLDPPR